MAQETLAQVVVTEAPLVVTVAPPPVDRATVVREAAQELVYKDNMPVEHVAQSVVEDMTKK